MAEAGPLGTSARCNSRRQQYVNLYIVCDVSSEMRETTFSILTALATGPKHGYGIIREVRTLSGQRITLRAGSLYGALDRLSADGLVRRGREEIVDGRLRRYYELTDSGATALAQEARLLAARSSEALRRLTIAAQPA